MAKYKEYTKNKCQKCKELITTTVHSINSICLTDPESCCFETDYGISFPTDACEFARTYKSILSSIHANDISNSTDSRITWNNCVKNNIESLELCRNKGKCAEIPPNPSGEHILATEWCNKKFPISKDQVSCWECIAENSPCDSPELESICSNLKNCRDNSLLDIIDPAGGELLTCLEQFSSGECCNQRIKSTKGMSKSQKQFFWEQRIAEG